MLKSYSKYIYQLRLVSVQFDFFLAFRISTLYFERGNWKHCHDIYTLCTVYCKLKIWVHMPCDKLHSLFFWILLMILLRVFWPAHISGHLAKPIKRKGPQ